MNGCNRAGKRSDEKKTPEKDPHRHHHQVHQSADAFNFLGAAGGEQAQASERYGADRCQQQNCEQRTQHPHVEGQHAKAQQDARFQSPSGPDGCWSVPAGNHCGAWVCRQNVSAVCAAACRPGQNPSPHAGVHQVHPQQPGDQEVDVARSGLAGSHRGRRQRVFASGGGLQGVIHLGTGQHTLRTGWIVPILKASLAVGNNDQIVFPQTKPLQRFTLGNHVSAKRGLCAANAASRLRAVSARDRRRSLPGRCQPACCGRQCPVQLPEARETRRPRR